LKRKDPVATLLRDARTGLLALLALRLIIERGPLHGYAVRRLIEQETGKIPPESSVYDALKRLEKLGLVESYWARSSQGTIRKYYKAKPNADEVLGSVLRELCPLVTPILCEKTASQSPRSNRQKL